MRCHWGASRPEGALLLKRSLRLAAVATIATVLLVPAVAIGSHDFVDVPDDHIFHSAISWMADNEVTKGCNPPTNDQYCPGDNVTRGQMAAFMQRLSNAKVVDAATAVAADDSALLEGSSVDDLKVLTFADMEVGLGTVGLVAPSAAVMSLDIEVPVDGSIVITHSTSFELWMDPTAIAVGPALDGCDTIPFQFLSFAEVGAGDEYDSAAGVVAYNVEAGAHTISYCATAEAADVVLINNQLGVVYEPGGVVPVIEPPPILMSSAEVWGN